MILHLSVYLFSFLSFAQQRRLLALSSAALWTFSKGMPGGELLWRAGSGTEPPGLAGSNK